MAPRRLQLIDISLCLSMGLFFLSLYVIFFSTTPKLSLAVNRELKQHKKVINAIQKDIFQLEKEIKQLLFNKNFQSQFAITEKRKTITKLSIPLATPLALPLKKISYKKISYQENKKIESQYYLSKNDLKLNVPYIKNENYIEKMTFFFNASSWLNDILKNESLTKKKISTSPKGNILLIAKEKTISPTLLKRVEYKIADNHGSSGQYHLKKERQNILFTFLPEINTYLISLFPSSKSSLTLPAIILLAYSILQTIILLVIALYQQVKKQKISPRTSSDSEMQKDIFDFTPPKLTLPSSPKEDLSSLETSLEEIPDKLYQNKVKKPNKIDKLLFELKEKPGPSLLSIGQELKKAFNKEVLGGGLKQYLSQFPDLNDVKFALLVKGEDGVFQITYSHHFSNATLNKLKFFPEDILLDKYLVYNRHILIKDNVDKSTWLTDKIASLDLSEIKSIAFIPIIKVIDRDLIICLAA